MTSSTLQLPSTPRPRRRVRADPLAAALLVATAVGVVVLWIAIVAAHPASGGSVAGRVAIVVDAGGRPAAALAAAERSHARSAVAIRVPRTAFESATDVRYFAAQGYGTVVAVGPLARAAARAAAPDYPRTHFTLR